MHTLLKSIGLAALLVLLCPVGAFAQKTVSVGQVSVELPEFKGLEPELDKGPFFLYGNTEVKFIYNVFKDLKTDLRANGFSLDLDGLFENMLTSVKTDFSDPVSTGPIKETVGGLPVKHQLLQVFVNGQWFHFQLAMYESPTAFYSVVITYDGDQHDRFRTAISRALHSFKAD
jgi:hypothetical protein